MWFFEVFFWNKKQTYNLFRNKWNRIEIFYPSEKK